ncbi:flagellar assembly protein FliW [Geothermobacter hydrogeniphilus]|uniref:Flagellar assembly factor FliW n=1 Tax=Geothermobacter hydrogeniphilus TaxID=1969733 RepID=A0A2K2HD42_9BACT|nr:flagellar assembly protein FliW [Geothermobacter hydrogeniphilus]PNU21151.1 flagellar assembly protein FliW [Geothermobacter hydrogeniphilus]
MKINGTRFGDIEFSSENTIHFPDGLIGFEDLHDFIVMPNRQESPLFWIQSVDDADIAFLLTDPNNFFLDYNVVPDKNEQGKLKASEAGECYALAVVTIHDDKSVTLNLAAPIIFSPETNRAIQVILEGAPYNTRTPLPQIAS